MAKDIFSAAFESASSQGPVAQPSPDKTDPNNTFDNAFLMSSEAPASDDVVAGEPAPSQTMFPEAEAWLTGANRRKDVPVWGEGVKTGLSSNQDQLITSLIMTSFDDDRIQAGIKKIAPQSEFSKDEFGNLIVSIPSKTGTVQFYPNPSGMDIPTVSQAGVGGLGAIALRRPIGAVGLPTEGFFGASATGAVEAGLAELASSQISGEPYNPAQPISGLVAGPIGHLAGKGFTAAFRAVSPIVDRLVNVFKRSPQQVVQQSGALTPEVRQAVQQAGLDPDEVTKQFWASVQEMTKKGVPEQQAIAFQQSMGVPTPIPMTVGEVTGNMQRQIAENVAEKGGSGETARALMEEQRRRQSQAIEENIPAMQQVIAGESSVIGRGAGGASAQESLVALRGSQEKAYKEAYKQARESGSAFVDPNIGDQIAVQIGSSLGEFRPRTSPGAFGLYDELSTMLKEGRSVDELMNLRKAITKLAASTDGNERGAAGALLRSFDENMLSQADDKLLYGNPESVKSWLDAIGKFKEFQQLWNTKGGILSKLTKTEMRDGQMVLSVAPEAAANAIFGTGISGVASKPSLTRDLLTLKKNLPEEQWNGLRQELFLLLGNEAKRTGVEGATTGVSFNRAWSNLKTNNPSLVKAMFTKDEISMINNFGATVSRIGSAQKQGSNSALAAQSMLGKLASSFGSSNVGWFIKQMPFVKGMAVEPIGAARFRPTDTPYRIPTSNIERLGTGISALGMGPEGFSTGYDLLMGNK